MRIELATERARDAAAERRLADAGRADEAEDRALLVLLQLADGEVLEDALLDLLEAVVVLVEDLAHRGDVEVVRASGACHGRSRIQSRYVRTTVYSAEPTCIVRRRLSCFFATALGLGREVRLGDALLEAVEIALIAVVLAELFLDRLELLAEHVLALVLAHLLFDLGVDALAHLEDLELAREEAQHLADALLHVDRLEQLRLLLDRRVEVRGDEIGERARRLDRVDERARFARQLGHQLDDLLGDVAQAHRERLGLVVLDAGSSSRVTFALRYGAVCVTSSSRMRVRPCRMSE